jgi:hypothetical protein
MPAQVLSLIRLRRLTVARIAATVLLTLVLLPFTAPFSTIDLGEIAGDTRLQGDLLSSSKTVKDASADLTLAASLHLLAGSGPVHVVCAGVEVSRSTPQFVLRL